MRIVTIVGNPRTPSRTRLAADRFTAILEEVGGRATMVDLALIPVGGLAHGAPEAEAREALDDVLAADLVLIVTPVYKASYTGLLKPSSTTSPITPSGGRSWSRSSSPPGPATTWPSNTLSGRSSARWAPPRQPGGSRHRRDDRPGGGEPAAGDPRTVPGRCRGGGAARRRASGMTASDEPTPAAEFYRPSRDWSLRFRASALPGLLTLLVGLRPAVDGRQHSNAGHHCQRPRERNQPEQPCQRNACIPPCSTQTGSSRGLRLQLLLGDGGHQGPERWDASWEGNLKLARLADEARIEFMLPIALPGLRRRDELRALVVRESRLGPGALPRRR
ncbi:MAG: NAD(P)H-dependent oxidoreductase [Actinomycetota bacterium]